MCVFSTGYSLIDALYQGDIFLPESTASREPDKDGPGAVRNRRASTNVLSRLWPLGVIPYKIHSDLHHGECSEGPVRRQNILTSKYFEVHATSASFIVTLRTSIVWAF